MNKKLKDVAVYAGLCLLCLTPMWLPKIVNAQGVRVQPVQTYGVPLANSTSTTAANSTITSAQTVTLTAPSTNITISVDNTGSASNVYINFAGTATTSCFKIPGGRAFTFQALPAVSSFSIIADGAVGNYSVFAH